MRIWRKFAVAAIVAVMALGVLVAPQVEARDLLVTSGNNNSILRVNSETGAVSVFASGGDLSLPRDLAFGPDGKLYVASYGNHRVLRYNADGTYDGVYANSASIEWAYGLAFDANGKLYVGSQNTHTIYRVDGYADLTPFASGNGLSSPSGLTFGSDGKLYVSNIGTDTVLRFNGDGTYDSVFVSTNLNDPMELGFGPDGKFYVASFRTGAVVRFYNNGNYETPFASNMYKPLGFVFDPDTDEIYVGGPTFGINKFPATGGTVFTNLVAQGTNGLDQAHFMTFVPEVVPEPSSLLALLTGGAGLLGYSIRRRS